MWFKENNLRSGHKNLGFSPGPKLTNYMATSVLQTSVLGSWSREILGLQPPPGPPWWGAKRSPHPRVPAQGCLEWVSWRIPPCHSTCFQNPHLGVSASPGGSVGIHSLNLYPTSWIAHTQLKEGNSFSTDRHGRKHALPLSLLSSHVGGDHAPQREEVCGATWRSPRRPHPNHWVSALNLLRWWRELGI